MTEPEPDEEPEGARSEEGEGRRPRRGGNPERTTAFLNLLTQVVLLIGPIIDLFR